ncbi:MAG: 2-oxoacid:acceptor oxidoreductase family protein [Pseudomonadota bacterium]
MAQYEVTFAGFGGQGVMVAGQLLAYSGIAEGKNALWLPSYGPEMRGGTAYCTVVISDKRISSPIINNPQAVCIFNPPSYEKFMPHVKPGGVAIVNSSLITLVTDRTDITEIRITANALAMKSGNVKAINIAMLGALIGASGVVGQDTVKKVLTEKLGKKKSVLDINMRVFEQGFKLAGEAMRKGNRL